MGFRRAGRLVDLDDVVLNALANGQILEHNNAEWGNINTPVGGGGGGGAINKIATWNTSVEDISDVTNAAYTAFNPAVEPDVNFGSITGTNSTSNQSLLTICGTFSLPTATTYKAHLGILEIGGAGGIKAENWLLDATASLFNQVHRITAQFHIFGSDGFHEYKLVTKHTVGVGATRLLLGPQRGPLIMTLMDLPAVPV